MTTIMKKQSLSYDQHQLKVICDRLCDNIEYLFEVLELDDIKHNGKMYVGNCPIHNGDNTSAFNLYPDGEHYRGNWKCRSHGCDKVFKGSIIGFIRGVISNRKYKWQNSGDKTASFSETIKFIENFLGNKVDSIKISSTEIEKKKFAALVANVLNSVDKKELLISREHIKKSLEYPCEYFINRGFSQPILNKYDVGICNKPNKEMYGRAVVPIYDHDHKFMVGCSGRSLFEKCHKCGSYHDPNTHCPNQEDKWRYSKWKHSSGFLSQNHLYNFWFAKKHILESSKVILVESPGNVWKLEEAGIHNSVGLFGSNLSDRQKILLDGSGAMTIITIMDNDEAGTNAAQSIFDKCKNTYNIVNIKISKNDIGDMNSEEINTEIKSLI